MKRKVIVALVFIAFVLIIQIVFGWSKVYLILEYERVSYLISKDSTNANLYRDRWYIGNKYNEDGYIYYDYDLNKHLELGGQDTLICMDQGIGQMLKDPRSSVRYFTMALNNGMSCKSNLYSLRAISYQKIRDYKAAINDLILVMSLDSSEHNEYYIAENYALLGDYLRASEYALNSDGHTAATYLFLAGRYKDAIVASYRNNNVEYYIEGLSKYRLGNYADALQSFYEAVKINSSDYCSELMLAKLNVRLGDMNSAVKHFNSAIYHGFEFYDILESDVDFKKILNDGRVNNPILAIIKNGQSVKSNTLKQIYKKDSAYDYDKNEPIIISERMNAILMSKKYISEYRKLLELDYDRFGRLY
jgi:tetratricopeptide (TPR) repeat protein